MAPRKFTESNSAEFASTSPLEEKAHIKLGQWGETAAAKYLTENGYEIILRNWKCPEGEIDIVAVDGSSLVIVEVKTRDHSLNSNFNPVEAIDARKVSKLKRLANRLIFLERMLIKRHHPQRIRFDVIAIIKNSGQAPFSIEHIIDAFNY